MIEINDTNPEFTLLGNYRFPKGTKVEYLEMFLVDKSGDLIPYDQWSFNVPGYYGGLGVVDKNFDVAATRILEMLKNKGWIK